MPITTHTTLKNLLSELVAMPTLTSEPATCNAALDWIRYQLSDLPLHVHEIGVNGGKALVVTTRDTKRPAVMLHTHIDISPADPHLLQLVERGGKYFGRGVFDMKFAAATYIQLLTELGDDLPQYDLGVTFTTDEEVECLQSVHLAAAGWGGGVMINPDAVAGWDIQRAAKGNLRYRVFSEGQTGHGSRPWKYRSAVSQLLAFLDDMAGQFPAEPCGDPEHGHNTMNIGLIQGGAIANQVAGEAMAEIDLRFMPGVTLADMQALFLETLGRHDHLTFKQVFASGPIQIDTTSKLVVHMARLIEEVSGAKPAMVLSHGGSESGFYADHGIPVIMFSPDGGGHHGADEWVSAQGVADFYEVIRRFVEQTARV